MQLRVRLFAGLRERAGSGELQLDDLPDELDVALLKTLVAARYPELGDLTHVSCVVDEVYALAHTRLGAHSRVALLPPVSGGSSATVEQGIFELCPDALDLPAALARVAHPACGASVLFTGTTRDSNRDRTVRRLDYEAFHEMAGPEMARIFGACLASHGPAAGEPTLASPRRLRMYCVHRIGSVGVGEPSVAIAVASPHREQAFLAARFLIDELKARLPVWKREVYADGQHWIGDRS